MDGFAVTGYLWRGGDRQLNGLVQVVQHSAQIRQFSPKEHFGRLRYESKQPAVALIDETRMLTRVWCQRAKSFHCYDSKAQASEKAGDYLDLLRKVNSEALRSHQNAQSGHELRHTDDHCASKIWLTPDGSDDFLDLEGHIGL